MGLFDYLNIEDKNMLPVKEDDKKIIQQITDFQTKSLDSYMEVVRITRTGTIEVKRGSWLNGEEYIQNKKSRVLIGI